MTHRATIATTAAAVAAITRTQDQIVQRLNDVRQRDVFGFEWPEYLGALDFAHAKPFLKPGTTEAAWNKVRLYSNTQSIIATMKGYMNRAWQSANGKQGVNTARSLMHYQAWIWLLGEDEFLAQVSAAIPTPYGKDALKLICEKFGFKSNDDGDRSDPPLSGLGDQKITPDTKEQVAEAKVEGVKSEVPANTMDVLGTIDLGDSDDATPATENDALASLLSGVGGSNPNIAALLAQLGALGDGVESLDPLAGAEDDTF